MSIFRKVIKKLSIQTGAFLLGGLLTWGAIAGIGFAVKSMYDFYQAGKKETEKAQEQRPKSDDAWSQAEALTKYYESFPKTAARLGETAVKTTYDEYGVLSLMDHSTKQNQPEVEKSGQEVEVEPQKVKEMKEKGLSSEEIKKLIAENDLSDDLLTKDIVISINDVTVKNASSESTKEVVKETVSEVAVQTLTASGQAEKDTSDEVKENIKKELNEKNSLEDQRVIDLREKLTRSLNQKRFIEEKIAEFEELENKGYIISETSELGNLKKQIQNIDKNIAELDDELGQYEAMVSEAKEIENDTAILDTDDQNTSQEAAEQETKEDTNIEEDTSGETTIEDNTTEDTTTEETTEEQVVEEESKGSITLSGYIASGKGNVSMTINLDTGGIYGNFTYDDKAGDCDVRVVASISGSMDLDTNMISTSVSGTAYYSGSEDYCNTTEAFTDSLDGSLSQDRQSASGKCAHGESWYISR